MAKLKDLLNENSFSLVGGVVSTPAIGRGTNTGLTDIVEDMYGKSERVTAKEVQEAISQFKQYGEVLQNEQDLKKIDEDINAVEEWFKSLSDKEKESPANLKRYNEQKWKNYAMRF